MRRLRKAESTCKTRAAPRLAPCGTSLTGASSSSTSQSTTSGLVSTKRLKLASRNTRSAEVKERCKVMQVNENLLIAFVALTAVAVVIQTGIVAGLYYAMHRMSRQADRAFVESRKMLGPL